MPRDLEHRTWWHLSFWYMLQQLYANVAQHIEETAVAKIGLCEEGI